MMGMKWEMWALVRELGELGLDKDGTAYMREDAGSMVFVVERAE
jgi:hypothetical protein